MTSTDLRRRLAVRGQLFTLQLDKIKERAGQPLAIAIVPHWCSKTHRDLIILKYPTDDGLSEIHGLAGFINGQQALFDAWITLTPPDQTGVTDVDARGTQIALADWSPRHPPAAPAQQPPPPQPSPHSPHPAPPGLFD